MPLDVFQQVFALSLASNLVNNFTGDQIHLQKFLQLWLTSFLPGSVGADWQLAWGPVVWKKEPENTKTGPDNTWYLAFHPSLQFEDGSVHPTYVIAISTTPEKSLHSLFTEDYGVITVVDFNTWIINGIKNPPNMVFPSDVVDSNAYIAAGTVNAAHLLLTTPAPEGAISEATSLLDVITYLGKSAPARFIFTGHGLGGALSPSLALALVLAGFTPADGTLTYPTAGPSPGNVSFTDLFVKTLPARKSSEEAYKGWNLNLVNTLDVVPQAWCSYSSISPEQNLGNVPTIYGRPILNEVLFTTSLAISWSRASNVLYKPLPSQYFTGTPPPATPADVDEFKKIIGQQHGDAYFKIVGVGNTQPDKSTVIRNGLIEKTESEILSNHPFAVDLVWALEHPKEAQEIGEKLRTTAEVKALLGEVE